ncbi:MAG: ribonuclease D [Arenicellales bacterium]
MTNIKIINDQASLKRACEELNQGQTIALDTEFMREKTFVPLLCLIQVCSDNRDYCIDPLKVQDLSPFADLVAQPEMITILHSCRQDFEALDTRISKSVANLFDTQLAAAFCGYGDQVSYAGLVEILTGTKLAKSHTRANWQKRPLSSAEIEYAMDDVRYLEPLHDQLSIALERAGRLPWFVEECQRQLDPDYWRVDPEQAWKRLKGGGNLPAQAQETARRLAIWREHQAIRRDRPREWVLSTAALLQISRLNPETESQLIQIEEVNTGVIRNSADAILEICASSARDHDAEPLWVRQQMLDAEQKKRVKGVMTMLRQAAEELGISASLLANRNAVERFVRDNAEIDLFRGWRREVIGEQVLRHYS